LGIVERKEREKLQRQNDIIDAAEEVFVNIGFENATMDDIASKAELSKGTLYLYFQSKTELCLAIVLRGLKIISAKFRELRSVQTSGLGKIQLLARSYLDFYKQYPNYIFAFSNYRMHKSECKHNSQILDEIIGENEKINDSIKFIVNTGIEDNSIKNEIDADKISYVLWGQLSGLIPNLVLIDDSEEVKFSSTETFNYMIKLIQDALRN